MTRVFFATRVAGKSYLFEQNEEITTSFYRGMDVFVYGHAYHVDGSSFSTPQNYLVVWLVPHRYNDLHEETVTAPKSWWIEFDGHNIPSSTTGGHVQMEGG